MAIFTHSILAPNQAIAADGDVTYELPVSPISALLLHVNPLNETSTITNYQALAGLLSAIDNVTVAFRGASVLNASGADLAALAHLYHHLPFLQSNQSDDDNERRSIVLPVLFGRRPYDPAESLPATKRGEMLLTITWDIAATGFDGLRISIETIELPEANPDHFQKVTTQNQTFAATGANDIDLPLGNPLRAVLLWGTTPYTGGAPAPSLGALRLLAANREHLYASTDFEVLRAAAALWGTPPATQYSHLHAVNAAGAGQEDTRGVMTDASALENYALMLLDVLNDDTYTLDTAGLSRLNIRVTAETADAVRALPVETMLTSDLLSAGGAP